MSFLGLEAVFVIEAVHLGACGAVAGCQALFECRSPVVAFWQQREYLAFARSGVVVCGKLPMGAIGADLLAGRICFQGYRDNVSDGVDCRLGDEAAQKHGRHDNVGHRGCGGRYGDLGNVGEGGGCVFLKLPMLRRQGPGRGRAMRTEWLCQRRLGRRWKWGKARFLQACT